MTNTERDTHFQGFAKLLLEELMAKYDHLPPGEWGPAEKDELIIARRAYDLVYSAIEFLRYSPNIRPMQLSGTETWVHFIPDLTAWPDTSSKS